VSAVFPTAPAAFRAQQFEVITGRFGCRIERLTTSTRGEYQFQGVSRDGEWLLYGWTDGEDADGNPVQGSERMNLVTGQIVPLPPELDNGGTFSADGATVVGVRYVAGGPPDLYVLDLASGQWHELLPDPAADFLASFSADGTGILFNSSRNGNSDVYLYERAAGTLRQLTDYEGYDAHAELSPDGRRILFHRMVSDRVEGRYDFDLYAYELETGEETRLTWSPFEESYGSWAPDSRTLVFSSDFEGQPEEHSLYVRHPDGSTSRLTGAEGWKDSYSYWTRDGRYIYFNSTRGGNADVYRIAMNGTGCVPAF
jgi:Tol biopolymer transport system component